MSDPLKAFFGLAGMYMVHKLTERAVRKGRARGFAFAAKGGRRKPANRCAAKRAGRGLW